MLGIGKIITLSAKCLRHKSVHHQPVQTFRAVDRNGKGNGVWPNFRPVREVYYPLARIIPVHVYLTTIGNPGTLEACSTGTSGNSGRRRIIRNGTRRSREENEHGGEEGRRYLSCSACFFKWPYKRLKCPYCGNEDPDLLTYFEAGEEPTRVGVCRKCARYIKTRDSRKGHGDIPLEIEDLATLHLDLLAGKEGFERGK